MNHIALTNNLLSELSQADPKRFLYFCSLPYNRENLPKQVIEHMDTLVYLTQSALLESANDSDINQAIYKAMGNEEIPDAEVASFETSQEIREY